MSSPTDLLILAALAAAAVSINTAIAVSAPPPRWGTALGNATEPAHPSARIEEPGAAQ